MVVISKSVNFTTETLLICDESYRAYSISHITLLKTNGPMPHQYTLHLCVVFCLFWTTAFAQTAQDSISPEKKERYHIHIGTYQKLIPNSYFKQAGLDKVKYHKDANSFHRYYLGLFDSKEVAEKNCKKATEVGFPNAKVVSTENDKIAQILDARKNTYQFYEVTYDELFLRTVHFDSNSAALDDPAQQLLHEVYMVLVRNPKWIVQLSGHSDSVGSPEYNIKLSKNRVRSVKRHLLKYGIQAERIKTRVFGEAAPIAKNREKTGEDVPSGRQLNRRVCIGIYDENGEMVNIKDSTIVPFDAELGN